MTDDRTPIDPADELKKLSDRLAYAAGFMRGRTSRLGTPGANVLVSVAHWLEGFAGMHTDVIGVSVCKRCKA